MFENFVSFDYIMTFTGMVILVGLLTQFTKSMLDKIVENKTKYLVYGYSLFFCIVAAVLTGTWTGTTEIVQTIITWGINSVVIWFAAMKAYEVSKSED
jgi:hypothetical protein